MFEVRFTQEAIDDLRSFRSYDQQQVITAIESQLEHQPTNVTRNRKRLRPNQLAEWELRVGDFRVFYDADSARAVVSIVAVGRKQGNKLFVHGQEYEL
jgi:mRNA-degrading endonuclease RelE of RelBE toxin-antitoxin system